MNQESRIKKVLKDRYSLFIIRNSKKLSGFTLIELLVVMTIIGVLAALSLFALSGARESARDGRRKSDLEAIRSALELYKADCNSYRSASGNVTTALDTDGGAAVRLIGIGSPTSCALSNAYLERIPNDTLTGRNYYYSSNVSGTTYQLCAYLEQPPTSPDSCSGGLSNCGLGYTCNYRVNNP